MASSVLENAGVIEVMVGSTVDPPPTRIMLIM